MSRQVVPVGGGGGVVDDICMQISLGLPYACNPVSTLKHATTLFSTCTISTGWHRVHELGAAWECVQRGDSQLVCYSCVSSCTSVTGPIDIREHNRRIILGLIWHLILHYQIFGYRRQSTNTPTRPVRSPTPKPLPKSANKVLMNWLRAAMPEDCEVKNVTSSWNDGKNLSALVNTMKPGLCPNYASLSPSDALPNTKKAMDQAEKEFDIPQIIHPEHLCIDEPDKLSCMTYLSYFCSGDDSPGYNSLLEWVRSKIPDYNIENFTDDWRDGRALSALVNAIAEGTVPNHAELDPSKGVDNIRSAMKTASDNLDGIENNITPEEFAGKRTDALAMMGYIEWFRKARPKQRESLSAVGPGG